MKRTASTLRLLFPVLFGLASACQPSDGTNDPMVESFLTGTDLTPTSAANVSEFRGRTGTEGLDMVRDNNANTKLYIPKPDDWIGYRMPGPAIIASYDITSANDNPDRDPKNWTFEGSNDAIAWAVLDTQVDQAFTARFQTKPYTFSNSTSYLYYRLNITDNFGVVGDLQLAEFRVGGSLVAGTVPGVPNLSTITVNSNAVTLTWSAAASATGYFIQRTDDGRTVTEVQTASTSYTDANLTPGTTYVYQVQAVNSTGRGYPSAFRRATTAAISTAGLKDVTALAAAAPTEEFPASGGIAGEEVDKVTDNNPYTKYIELGATSTWIKLDAPADAVVTRYTLTSANDFPSRDPQSWTLEGSPNDSTWTVLDTRAGQSFVDRFQKRTFTCNENNQAFRYYRLTILSNHGDPNTQLAEWRLLGTTAATLAAPAAPTGLSAQALSGYQIKLTWTDNAAQLNPEASYRIERATNSTFTQNLVVKSTGANSAEFRATGLSPGQAYFFRVAAVNATGDSATLTTSATTTTSTPPATLSETGWDNVYSPGFNRTLFQTYTDANVAVYFDEFVPNRSSISWINTTMSQVWSRVKSSYGDMVNPILYVVGNQSGVGTPGRFEGGGLLNAFDPAAGYRNLAFVHSSDWSTIDGPPGLDGWNLGALTHESGHVVEFVNNGAAGSPSFPVWGDSKWAEIYQWDLYTHVPSIPQARIDALFQTWQGSVDAEHGRFWFRDWYYPLYTGSFGNVAADKKDVAMLSKYFQLLAEQLPRRDAGYGRDITLGEVIHFYAGAAGVDLEDEARIAFAWTPEVEIQLAKAQVEFTDVSALYRGNLAPAFTFDPMTRSATVAVALTGTLAGTAADPDPTDTLTYSKQGGPTWLTVASNGTLGGTPPTSGSFAATVRVTDQGGLFDDATLTINAGGSCAPETNAAFCARLAATCGALSGTDNCGASRTVTSCGACTAPQTCGGDGTPNVCGGGGSAAPCADLCSGPTAFTGPSYNSGNLGAGATCHQTVAALTSANCGNFAAGRTLRINGTLVTCDGGNITLPAARNGGYCFQASAGDFAWAYFGTW